LYKQNAEDKRLLMEKMDRMNDKIIENETHSKDSFESTKKLGEELAKIQTMTKTMQNETTNLPSINKNINDIAMMYNNSKLRGNIGEVQLESLLRDGFSYGNILKTQHPVIRNGVNLGIVDFYLELVPNDDSKNIYIDSKFNKDN
jgi:DNA recombination protein RmuC